MRLAVAVAGAVFAVAFLVIGFPFQADEFDFVGVLAVLGNDLALGAEHEAVEIALGLDGAVAGRFGFGLGGGGARLGFLHRRAQRLAFGRRVIGVLRIVILDLTEIVQRLAIVIQQPATDALHLIFPGTLAAS